jgi:hypothetical protein
MKGAKTDVCAKINKNAKRINTIRIGASHHFLRTRRKRHSSPKIENFVFMRNRMKEGCDHGTEGLCVGKKEIGTYSLPCYTGY